MRGLPFLGTVRARLLLWNVVVFTLVFFGVGLTLRVTVARQSQSSMDRELTGGVRQAQAFIDSINPLLAQMLWRQGAHSPASLLAKNGTSGSAETLFTLPQNTGPPSHWQTHSLSRLFNLNGQPLTGKAGDTLLDRRGFLRAAAGKETYAFISLTGEPVRVLSAPLRSDGKIVAVLQVAYSMEDMERVLHNLDHTLLGLIVPVLLVVVIGSLFLTAKMLQPVRAVTQTASRISAENLAQRLPVQGRDEFSALAMTFNTMLARLEQSFEQQRRFTADASHELRTPLTVIKSGASRIVNHAELSEAHRKVIQRIDKAADVMHRLVQDLLLLARSDAGQMELTLTPLALAEVVATAIGYVQPGCEAAIDNNIAGSSWIVYGESSHLLRLFVNLLENASRHTPSDGRITLAAQEIEKEVVITIVDTGCGISPEHLPHICERFYRGNRARTRLQGGSGLGLAICQSIIAAHGGSFDLTSALGVGTTVCIRLPRQ